MALPTDYLGPDAKEHDYARLTKALFAGNRRGQRHDIEVRYCQIPTNSEQQGPYLSLHRIHMQCQTGYEADMARRTITLYSPSIVEINTDAIPILPWNDLLAAFEHELAHHDMRTASFRKICMLANERIEKESSHEMVWRLRNMARFAHNLDELFAYEQGVEDRRSTRGFRRTQMDQYYRYLDDTTGIIQSDEELFGSPPLEPIPLVAALEGAYRALTGEDVDTYAIYIAHRGSSNEHAPATQEEHRA